MHNLEEIINGCKEGDAPMQRELYNRYSPRFYSLCRRYAKDDEMADYALLDGFLTIFKNIDKYRGDGSFEGWMQKIFLRKIIHSYRKQNKYKTTFETISTANTLEEHHFYEVVDLDQRLDVNDALIESLRTLSAIQQTIFNMIAVDGYTFKNVADILNKKESTIKYHYYNACDIVKSMMIEKLGKKYIKSIL